MAIIDLATRILVRYHKRLWLALLLAATAVGYLYPQALADAFSSRDQQGRLLFWHGDYHAAAERFDDPRWRAYSHYADRQFAQTAAILAPLPQLEDAFAHANAMAHQKQYYQAEALYRKILRQQPAFTPARINLEMMRVLIAEMEKESSQAKAGKRKASVKPKASKQQKQPNNNQGQPGQGKRSKASQQSQGVPKQTWLNQVEQDPRDFLTRKFAMEYKQQQQEAKP